jgi:colanic acid/amylovoran biosynthesis glycosyltransferase
MAAGAKLGILIPQFPGQTHIFFWREIAALEARGVEVVLFSTTPPPNGLIAHDWSADAMARTEYLASRSPVNALRALPALPWGDMLRPEQGFLKDVIVSAPAAAQLVRAAKRHGLRHVHAHSCGRAALIAAMAARMGGPDYSLTLHGPLSDYGPGQNFKWRGARFATVITEKLLNEVRFVLRDDLPRRVMVQAMGVDTDRLKRDDQYQPVKPGQTIRLFSCGRLNPVKGHQDLMAAVRLLIDQGHKVELAIAGEDDAGGTGYRAELETRRAALRLQDHVTLLGAVDESTVRDHLMKAHVFALASWAEPLGVALMEAMSCGVPTIGTAAGGVRELITDGTDGLLVPPKDPRAMAAAILRIAGQPELARALSFQGRARIVAHFGAARGAEVLMQEVGLRPRPVAEDDLPVWPGSGRHAARP